VFGVMKYTTKIDSVKVDAPLLVDRVIVRSTPTGSFRRDEQQSPALFYPPELGKLSRPNRKGWAMADCPFHKSKSHRSLSVNLEHGGFHCFGCDAKGGGPIDFVMLRDSCDFKTAARQLGAWDDAAQPTPPPVMAPVKYLTFDYHIDGLHYHASVEDEPRNYAGLMRGFYRAAGAQLTALGPERAESDEGETCWARMALGLDELREIGIYE
jgi:CHC2-type zinc finger protein